MDVVDPMDDHTGQRRCIRRALDPDEIHLVPADVDDDADESEQHREHDRDQDEALTTLIAPHADETTPLRDVDDRASALH